jgi:segregation and condensation protein A
MTEIKNLNPNEVVHNLIFQEDDVTWQSVIYELAREGKIDPWDIDISVLSAEYLQMVRKLKEMNFRLSGKVILAAAVLLKMKAERIGLEQLYLLMNPPDELEIDAEDGLELDKHFTKAELQSRIPFPRKRKVTIFELVESLKKALEVDERRRQRVLDLKPAPRLLNIKKPDIFSKIQVVFSKLRELAKKFKSKLIPFEEIIPSTEKRDVIWTLIPLLHLANEGKLDLVQEEAFGKIFIKTSEKELSKPLKREKEITEDEKDEG